MEKWLGEVEGDKWMERYSIEIGEWKHDQRAKHTQK